MSRSLFGTAVSRWVPSSGGISYLETFLFLFLFHICWVYFTSPFEKGPNNQFQCSQNLHYFKILETPRSFRFTLILYSAQDGCCSFGLKLRDRYIRRFQIEVRPNEISTVEDIKRRSKDEQTRGANLEARLAKAENTRTSTRKLHRSGGSRRKRLKDHSR
jgi:hypothetical protein